MAAVPRFLIVDGYPKASRDEFNHVGMRLAWELYRDMLLTYLPDAEYDVWLSSDPGTVSPASNKLEKYAGVLWPGCNITIYHHDDPRVIAHLDLAQRAYEVGVPQFGTCWGIQLAVVAAGGEVKANPKGREMGIGRKIRLTEAGRVHPMYEGKPAVFDAVRDAAGRQRFQRGSGGLGHIQTRNLLGNPIPSRIRRARNGPADRRTRGTADPAGILPRSRRHGRVCGQTRSASRAAGLEVPALATRD
ncbi:MAG TPA: gamma-glutamyl-gamma-aminobutyrate hydrolase family protein [Candidatus Hydrogenedentes bacterium]|nr:gamma-glutamyl-gamma-aminobutyrate hydrolase family protein [Candidatus Hydrogenedentota bacterium]